LGEICEYADLFDTFRQAIYIGFTTTKACGTPKTGLLRLCFFNSFSSGQNVAILSGVVLNANIFQTIHHMETEIALFERGELPLSNDTNFNFITSLVDITTCINYDIKKCCNYALTYLLLQISTIL
jgi:hypothetical protein